MPRSLPRGLRARSRVLKRSFVMRVAASGQLVARQKFMPDEIRRMTSTKMSRIIAVAVVATDHPQLPRDNKDASVIFRKIIPETRGGPMMITSMFHASRFTFKNESKEIRNTSFALPSAQFSICCLISSFMNKYRIYTSLIPAFLFA